MEAKDYFKYYIDCADCVITWIRPDFEKEMTVEEAEWIKTESRIPYTAWSHLLVNDGKIKVSLILRSPKSITPTEMNDIYLNSLVTHGAIHAPFDEYLKLGIDLFGLLEEKLAVPPTIETPEQ